MSIMPVFRARRRRALNVRKENKMRKENKTHEETVILASSVAIILLLHPILLRHSILLPRPNPHLLQTMLLTTFAAGRRSSGIN